VYDAGVPYSSFAYLAEGIFYFSTPEDTDSSFLRKIGSYLYGVTSHKTVMFIVTAVRT
jgi:hypothetical protein